VVALLIVLLFGSTLWFLYKKSRPKAVGIETDKPFVTDIVKKSVAAGSIQPRKEIEIKPKISGILKGLLVEAGARVKRGDHIADVQIIPDVVNLNEAELRLGSAKLSVERAKRSSTGPTRLGSKGAAALGELDKLRSDSDLASGRAARRRGPGAPGARGGHEPQQGLVHRGRVDRRRHRAVGAGARGGLGHPGQQLQPRHHHRLGGRHDRHDLQGPVDESEVGKLKEGMPVEIVVGALEDLKFAGTLERISPKSLAKEGTTEFEIEAAFKTPTG
jgi:HlyD family secretion protein